MDYITVIGSTDISPLEEERLYNLTERLVEEGFSLRSGKAPGADQAAQRAVESFSLRSDDIRDHQIFLPWRHFELSANAVSGTYDIWDYTQEEIANAIEIVSTVHPRWEHLKQGQKKFHIRNFFQAVGLDCKTPSKGIIACSEYTRDDIPQGGTRTAWVVGQRFGIPCINIRDKSDRVVNEWVSTHLLK